MAALAIPPRPALLPTTIVVPCYEEAERLDVPAFEAYLEATDDVDFLFVDDGSEDATLEILEGLRARWPRRVGVHALPENRGKAEAVRQGVLRALEANPTFIGYWDADLATPLSAIEETRRVMVRDDGINLVMGARVALLGRSIQRKRRRHYSGRIFATAASLTLGLPVYDTQCGAKLFRVTERTASLFSEPFISRWIFDVELIARYVDSDDGGQGSLYEMPLDDWTDVGESKVKVSDFVRATKEMAQIYRRYK